MLAYSIRDEDIKVVTDYTFYFKGGTSLPITVDPQFDTLVKGSTKWEFQMGDHPSDLGTEDLIPGRKQTVYLAHVTHIDELSREVRPRTAEEQVALNATIRHLAGD